MGWCVFWVPVQHPVLLRDVGTWPCMQGWSRIAPRDMADMKPVSLFFIKWAGLHERSQKNKISVYSTQKECKIWFQEFFTHRSAKYLAVKALQVEEVWRFLRKITLGLHTLRIRFIGSTFPFTKLQFAGTLSAVLRHGFVRQMQGHSHSALPAGPWLQGGLSFGVKIRILTCFCGVF